MTRAATISLLLAVALTGCAREEPLPPLAAGLPADARAANAAFDARVKRLYPHGTPQAMLLTDLRRQGFGIGPAAGGDREADLYRPNGCGRTAWKVIWQVDAGGRLASAMGIYGFDCL